MRLVGPVSVDLMVFAFVHFSRSSTPTSSSSHLFKGPKGPPRPHHLPQSMPLLPQKPPLSPPQPRLNIPLGPIQCMRPPLPPCMPLEPPLPQLPPEGAKSGGRKSSGFGALQWFHSVLQVKLWFPHPDWGPASLQLSAERFLLWRVFLGNCGALLGGSFLCLLHGLQCNPLVPQDLLGPLDLYGVAAASLALMRRHPSPCMLFIRSFLSKINFKLKIFPIKPLHHSLGSQCPS